MGHRSAAAALALALAACPRPRPAPPPPAPPPADAETLIFPDTDGEDAYAMSCTAIDSGDELVSCSESYCDLAYRARRLEQSPAGFVVRDHDVAVEHAVDLAAGGRWTVREDARGLHAEIADGTGTLLLVDAMLGGGGASEATVARVYYGVAMTPGADVRLVAGLSRAGAPPTPARLVEEMRAGVRCELRINLFE